jgi:ABC-type multidrug transport system fused ATPase/permease subunit
MSPALVQRIRVSNLGTVARVLPRADLALATGWWILLISRGLLPAVLAVAMGALVGAVNRRAGITTPLAIFGIAFVLAQVLPPLHKAVGANLGSRTAAWLYDQLTAACVKPPGIAHLENTRLTTDLTVARDFDLGITGPPMSIAMDFIASGLIEMVGGIASAIVLAGYRWWAAVLLVIAWSATHWLLRESAIWRERNTDEVRQAQRHADYAYKLAVEPPAAKELRLFGLADWIVERFRARRRHLFELRWEATRLREQPLIWSILLVVAANVLVFWAMAADALAGRLPLAQLVTFASAAIGASMIGFGGLSWALDGTAAPIRAVLSLEGDMRKEGVLPEGRNPAKGMPAREIRFRNVTFAYPHSGAEVLSKEVLRNFDLTISAGSSLAIVGQNGAGKTTIAKLLCRLYDPQEGAIEVDGVDMRTLEIDDWRSRITAVFQDFIRFELPLRDNVAPRGAPDHIIRQALEQAGAANLASLDTILARGYPDGTDLSGGQWQRVALARALCAVKLGAGLVLLDEPTAQLDVRGEAEIFSRILAATRNVTTILISHRFSTVRHADRICVLEHGRVVELGSHDELMAAGGRYKTMFELQASRFEETEEGVSLEQLD